MPRLSNGMGIGAQSAEKFQDFEGIIDIVTKRAIGALLKVPTWQEPYTVIDLTSGPGYDELPNGSLTKGTPLLTMDRLHERHTAKDVRCATAFFERNVQRADQLRAALRQEYGPSRPGISYKVHTEDSNDWLEAFGTPEAMKGTMGAFIYDPTEAVDLDFLAAISDIRHLAHYDLLVYVSATSIKRPRRLPAQYQTDRRTLVERLTTINKRKIIVRKPSGPSEWSWFILTNDVHFPVWRKAAGRSNNLDFFDIATPDGSAVLEGLNWTRGERTNGHG